MASESKSKKCPKCNGTGRADRNFYSAIKKKELVIRLECGKCKGTGRVKVND